MSTQNSELTEQDFLQSRYPASKSIEALKGAGTIFRLGKQKFVKNNEDNQIKV